MNGIRIRFLSPLTLLVVLAGCGSTDPTAPESGSCTVPQGSMLPWKTGNNWTYRVTENGGLTTKITTIGDLEAVGGTGPNATKMAYKVVTKKGKADQTISWQAPDGAKVVRYREQSFSNAGTTVSLEEHWDPYKLHIDGTPEHTKADATWVETYRETKLQPGGMVATATAMDAWHIAAECEKVTIDDKTWDAIKITKTSNDTKTYWYVPGIGKVKEAGGQTEELVSYEVLQ